MTKSQELRIKEIESCVPTQLFHSDNYEIKKWEIKDLGHCISLYIIVGIKGDEGTFAEFLCREIVHLFIGKKGGITYYDVTKLKKMNNGIKLYEAREMMKEFI